MPALSFRYGKVYRHCFMKCVTFWQQNNRDFHFYIRILSIFRLLLLKVAAGLWIYRICSKLYIVDCY